MAFPPHGQRRGEDEPGEEEVHDHAGRDHEGARPDRLPIEIPRSRLPLTLDGSPFHAVHDLVGHPPHLHVTAQRDRGENVFGLSELHSPDRWPQADRKPLDLDIHRFGGEEVPQLVHEDQHPEHDDGRQDHHRHSSSLSGSGPEPIGCAGRDVSFILQEPSAARASPRLRASSLVLRGPPPAHPPDPSRSPCRFGRSTRRPRPPSRRTGSALRETLPPPPRSPR